VSNGWAENWRRRGPLLWEQGVTPHEKVKRPVIPLGGLIRGTTLHHGDRKKTAPSLPLRRRGRKGFMYREGNPHR